MSNFYPKIWTPFHRDEKNKKVNIERFTEYSPLYIIYPLINKWDFTEKLDGANISILYSKKEITIRGRTEKAEPIKEIINFINDKINLKYLNEEFEDKELIIYGEGFGGKIQRGKSGCLTERFIGFDVKVNGKWLSSKNAFEIIQKAGFETVPFLFTSSLKEAVEFVKKGFFSKASEIPVQAEGLIGRTSEPLITPNGDRLILKLKTKDFES